MNTRAKVIAGAIAVVLVAALAWWKLSDRRGASTEGDAADRGGTSLSSQRSGSGAAGAAGAAPGMISGRVTGPGGAPVAAAIRVSGPDTEMIATGADGRFEIADLAPGSYRVSAAAVGFRPAVSEPVALAAGGRETVELSLVAGGTEVNGRVVDISGGPVAGAFVEMTPIAGILEPQRERGFAAVSGADGTFAVSADPGVYVLTASHPDYVSRSERVEVSDTAPAIEIALVPGAVLEGVVLDAASGEPVGGASVLHARSALLRMPGMRSSEEVVTGTVTTRADGTFRITGIEPGVISLRAAGGGKVSREPVAVSLGIAESRSGVEIYVDAGFHIRGVVVDKKTKKPVPGAAVNAEGEGGGGDATTDDRGIFEIGPLAPGDYGIFAMGGDVIGGFMNREDVSIDGADITGVTLEVTTGVRVRGRVNPPGVASVSIDPNSADRGAGMMMLSVLGGVQTEADGVFDIGPVAPNHTLTLVAVSADGKRGELEVEVGADSVDGAVIELGAAARIAGTVTDSTGKPIAGVFVSAAPGGDVRRRVIVNGAEISGRRAMTGTDGRYIIGGLEAGSFQVSVTDPLGQRLAWTRPPPAGPDAPIAVELAARSDRALDLSVRAMNGVIRGVVRGPDGQPAPDVFVTATPATPLLGLRGPPGPPGHQRPDSGGPGDEDAHGDRDGPREESESMVMVVSRGGNAGVPISGSVPPVVTGPDGRFEIRGLRQGDYDLVAEGLGGSARAFADKVATGSEVIIDLASLTALAGVVTMDGKPVERFSIELSGPARFARTFRAADGRFRMPGLDPGRYTLRAKGGGGETSSEIAVAPGKTTEIEVVLQGQLEVRGRLIDGDGNPVARAMVLVTPARSDGEMSISISSSAPPPRSGDDGRFVARALPGTYVLVALAADAPRPLAQKRFELSSEDVDLGDISATGVEH